MPIFVKSLQREETMSELSFSDKTILENALNMHNGYVLNFTDRTFSDFFATLGIDINAENTWPMEHLKLIVLELFGI